MRVGGRQAMLERAWRLALMSAAATASAAVCPGGAAATAPARLFDAPGQAHARRCVRLASSQPLLRFGDGTPTGFSVRDWRTAKKRRCAPGLALLDLHEILPSEAGPLVFERPPFLGAGAGNAKYGELAVSDIAGPLPAIAPPEDGRGAACTLAAEAPYRVSVRSIPKAMHYKRPADVPSGSNRGTSFVHYGDPGADQGTSGSSHYTYLLWSFVDVHGGGMVRTLLSPGQVVQACDVKPITMSSWDSTGAVNGSVTARYVRVVAGTCPLYGWMVWSHTHLDRHARAVPHAVPVRDAPPPDPPPDPSCPVSPPAATP